MQQPSAGEDGSPELPQVVRGLDSFEWGSALQHLGSGLGEGGSTALIPVLLKVTAQGDGWPLRAEPSRALSLIRTASQKGARVHPPLHSAEGRIGGTVGASPRRGRMRCSGPCYVC